MIESPGRFAYGMAVMMIGAAFIAGAFGNFGFTDNAVSASAVFGFVPMLIGAWMVRLSIKPPRT